MEHTATAILDRPSAAPGAETPPSPPNDRPVRRPADPRPPASGHHRRWAGEGSAIFGLSFAVYLVVAVLLDFKYKSFNGDAVSRMANGFYVVFSRDPHLAAIGFVWTPLQSIADLVFLLGNHLWPALSHNDMAGSLVSALAMAGAVHQLHSALREWGINRGPRLLLTAFFALDPMIVYYAGNGMSEGLFLFTLVTSARYLIRWMHSGELRSLAYGATALGFAYLTRNEAAGAAVAGAAMVFAVTYWRTHGGRKVRVKSAASDAALFALPAIIAALGWAITSKVITGQFFGQFESIYGNSAQELLLQHKSLHGRAVYEFQSILSMWPLLAIVLPVALILAFRRRDARVLAPLGVLGGALGFDALSLLVNTIENDYRYFIATIPLEVLVVGSIVAALPRFTSAGSERPATPLPTPGRGVSPLGNAVALLLVLVCMIPAVITTGAAMFNPKIGIQETQFLSFIFDKHLSREDIQTEQQFPAVISIGDYLSNLHLPNGDVILDNAAGCAPNIITTISQPHLFVIPNDRDFQRTLADPPTFHAHYILEPNPKETPVSAENIEYPALWSSGAEFAKVVHDFPSRGGCPEYRLFKVLRHPNIS